MTETTLSSMLRGGDRRSLGRADSVVTLILIQPARFPELIECLWCDDAVIRMRAADAAEKISAQRPQLLRPFKAELLGLAAEASQPELRWHLALMIPRLPLTPADRKRALALLMQYLHDRSSIVKTCALQGLMGLAQMGLAQGDPQIQSQVLRVMEQAARIGTPAMKARARKLLPQLRN